MDTTLEKEVFDFIYTKVLLLNGITKPNESSSQDDINKYEQLKYYYIFH